jgi:uncharacterized lipoprotein
VKNIGLMVALFLMLAGCSAQYTSNGEQQYLHGRNGVNLVVPPPLTSENISHYYDLPPQNQDARIGVEPPA